MLELLLQLRDYNQDGMERDGGPMYAETNFDHFIAEPINGISAAIFIIIVAYFTWKLRGKFMEHKFMSSSLLLLLVGGVGGTIYHLFRLHPVFLHMDWGPIMILCLAASVFFYRMSGGKWIHVLIASAGYVAISYLMYYNMFSDNPLFPRQYVVNINYAIMAILILVPVYLILMKTKFHQARWIYIGVGGFVAAIIFRMLDATDWVQINLDGVGTHFLWHVFGALACFSIFQYVYELGEYMNERNMVHSVEEGNFA
ncbi:MAG: hypothetical protein AAFY71_20435 [Bacteroidota bacterium]